MNPSLASVFASLSAAQIHSVAVLHTQPKRALLANMLYMGISFDVALAIAKL